MEEKENWQRGLEAVREKAAANGNRIAVGEILACFPGIALSEEQIRLIYRYLEDTHIEIEDYEPHDTRSVAVGSGRLSGEEKAYFQMYLKDLEGVAPCTKAEEEILVNHLLGGDEGAQNRLIEGNLHRVLELARNRAGCGVLIGDLVQEGNMALVTAVEEYRSAGVRLVGEPLEDFLEKKIDGAMEALIREQSGFDRAAKRMAADANRLLELTKELEEELGREATLEELAKRMHLPGEYVEEVVRVSYHAMKNGDGSENQREKADRLTSGWDLTEEENS
ncbi:sigma-70 domain-containing protein [Hominifimenecus sp. rT4P-3]|uniref:sigma-70 domain-containing protein n=1 Tax=Hominifimenecus sp. rT4P-3 TaxID=3242979 RepID=UPI003DA230CE